MNEEKLCKLDWETIDIRLAKGRFTHTLRRPGAEMILERGDEIEIEIPIGKDGSFTLPDPTETEEIDATYYEKIKVEATGYGEKPIPIAHKAAAFQGIYAREIYLDEDQDIFADELCVIEEFGSQSVIHIIGQPDETELRKLRKKLNSGRVAPDKRGRQKYVTSSTLRAAMDYYRKWMVRVDGATANGEKYSQENREAFLAAVDPIIQHQVVKLIAEELTGNLLD